ncbi:MAG: hypothetical protein JXA43_01110 [Candidatus Diapherotrites archaeon]|nr:hypothetical protein [Candidatus Diapherotrites archaeon]
MGLLGKLFGKKEEEKEPVKVMSFDDAVAYIQNSETTLINEVYEGMEDACSQLKSFYKPLYEKLESKRELPERIPAQIRQKIDATRMQARKKLNVLNSNLVMPTDKNPDKLFDFHSKLTKNLFEMVQFATIYTQVISNALPNEEIPSELGEIKAINNSLSDFLEPKITKLRQHQELNRILKRYKEILESKGKTESLKVTATENEEMRQREKAELEKELKELTESEAYKKALVVRQDIEATEKKIGNHVNAVKTSITSIDRALRKWATANSRSHQLIDDYLNDTLNMIVNDKEQEQLMEIMNSLYDQVLSDEIDLKDNIKTRSLEIIDSFRGGTLRQSVRSIVSLNNDLEKLKAMYNPAIFKKENSIKISLSGMENVKSKSERFETNLGSIEEELKEKKQKIIDRLESQFNIRVEQSVSL